MTLYGADLFYADIQQNRILSITGQRGMGKTSMAFELAQYYLRRGYKLICNIDNIWQDDHIEKRLFEPDYIKHSVIIIDEAGHSLRKWEYFEPMVLYARKFDNFIFLPCVRPPHENLAEFVCSPVAWLSRILPGGLNYWTYSVGTGRQDVIGSYWYRPSCIGVFDTLDVSYEPDVIVQAFSAQISLEEIRRGRKADAVSKVEDGSDSSEQSALLARQAKIARAFLSVSGRKAKR